MRGHWTEALPIYLRPARALGHAQAILKRILPGWHRTASYGRDANISASRSRQALRDIIRNPIRTLVPPWSWKAAVLSALLRALVVFASNLRSGRREAKKAMLVEAIFAVVVGGLIGAISQHLRKAQPWATALLVWAGLPALMLIAQLGIHHFARTPHLGGGLTASFCLAALDSAFTCYAMRHGAMRGRVDETSILQDMKAFTGISLDVFPAPKYAVDMARELNAAMQSL